MFTNDLKFPSTRVSLSQLTQLQEIAMMNSSFWLLEHTQNIAKGKLLSFYYLFQFWNRQIFRTFMGHWLPVNNNGNWSETDICNRFDHEWTFGPETLACNLSKINFLSTWVLMLERSTLSVSIDWRKPPTVMLWSDCTLVVYFLYCWIVIMSPLEWHLPLPASNSVSFYFTFNLKNHVQVSWWEAGVGIPTFSAYTEMFLPNIINCSNDVSGPMNIVA